MAKARTVCMYLGEQLGRYGFGDDHPFGEDRIHAFMDEMHRRELDWQVRIFESVPCTEAELLLFHTPEYVARVQEGSRTGEGMLDYGDTPAYVGVYDHVSHVVGAVLDATHKLMNDQMRRCFVPIAGLHHARRDAVSGVAGHVHPRELQRLGIVVGRGHAIAGVRQGAGHESAPASQLQRAPSVPLVAHHVLGEDAR